MKKDTLLSLPSLVQGKNKFHYTIPAEDLSLDKNLNLLGNAEVELMVLRSGDKLLVEGILHFRTEINCAYCGETFTKEYSEPIESEYIKQDPKMGARSLLLSNDDIDRSYYQGETIDLLPLLHDAVLLAIPLAPTCQEDCKGICPGCGVNLNKESCRCKKTAALG